MCIFRMRVDYILGTLQNHFAVYVFATAFMTLVYLDTNTTKADEMFKSLSETE